MFARRGFSLIELAVVVVIAGLLAVTVVPAVQGLDESRVRAAASELERRLAVARGYAMATGEPAGLEIDAALERVRLVRIAGGQTDPSAMNDPLGEPDEWLDLGFAYAGVSLPGVTLGDGTTGSGTLWFGHDGTPEVRDGDALLVGDATELSVLTLSGFGRTWEVTVEPGTGAVGVEDAG